MLSAHRQDGIWSPISDEYDCTANVARLIDSASEIFDRIVLNTWDDNSGRQAKEVFGGVNSVTVVVNADPLASSRALKKPYTKEFPDNRVRQFFSTLAGLRACENDPTEVVAKVRTDQFLDLRALMASARKLLHDVPARSSCGHDLLLVPCLFGKPPFAADDSYFVARRSALVRFLEAQLSMAPSTAIADVHSAVMLVWYDAVLRDELTLGRWRTFPLSGRTNSRRPVLPNDEDHYRLAAELVFRALRPLPRSVYQSLIWRGLSIQDYEARAAEKGRLPPLLVSEDVPATPSALASLFQDLSEADRRPLFSSTRLARIVSYKRSGVGSLLNPIANVSRRLR